MKRIASDGGFAKCEAKALSECLLQYLQGPCRFPVNTVFLDSALHHKPTTNKGDPVAGKITVKKNTES